MIEQFKLENQLEKESRIIVRLEKLTELLDSFDAVRYRYSVAIANLSSMC